MVASLGYEGQLCDVFNLGESQTTTLSELIALIEKAVGKKAIIERKPEQPGDVPVTFADISKARAAARLRSADEDRGGHPEICRVVPAHAGVDARRERHGRRFPFRVNVYSPRNAWRHRRQPLNFFRR